MKDSEIIEAVLERDENNETSGGPTLSETEREAFPRMRDYRSLSTKQREWLRDAAARLGIVLPSANLFSSLSAKEQREHKERASRVQLPREREGFVKKLRPPGRR
jgi:hypothetical protein